MSEWGLIHCMLANYHLFLFFSDDFFSKLKKEKKKGAILVPTVWIQIRADPLAKIAASKEKVKQYMYCMHSYKTVRDCLDNTCVECMHSNLVGLKDASILSSLTATF